MSKNVKISSELIIAYAILAVLSSAAIVGSNYIGVELQNKKDSNAIEKTSPAKEDYPDLTAFEKGKKLLVAKDQASNIAKDFKKNGEVSKNILVTGQIDRAYLFIDVSVDDGQPLTIYDSIFVQLNGKGGHLRRDYSLPVIKGDSTKLLYDLRQIPYIDSVPYSESKVPQITNWLDEINNKKDGNVYSFLSTLRTGGMIKEITISYQCLEETDCSLDLK
jgi:hypothetical protein